VAPASRSSLPANLDRLVVAALILGSAFTAPLFTLGRLTFTGDRLLGIVAVGVVAALSLVRRLHWTPVHSALALFVAVQVFTTLGNARQWPHGLKFMTIYVLGFACFCLAAECARREEARRASVTWWIAVGAGLGVIATVAATWANLSRHAVWGAAIVQAVAVEGGRFRSVFAGRVTFWEPNLLSSFLLIPFALALWRWARGARALSRAGGALAGLVFGLTFGFTRAAWIATTGIVACWWWSERPPRRRVAGLAALLLLAFLLHTAVVGVPVLERRVITPIETGYDQNLWVRWIRSRVTVESWLARPVVGHGAGSLNRLSIVGTSGRRLEKIWNGNLVLFVLHDSGLLGLGALVWLGVVVWRRGIRSPTLGIPLLAIGAGLCFAFQFTHGLWMMYPYVYLGLLTAETGDPPKADSLRSPPR
jgi:hypothetical protein